MMQQLLVPQIIQFAAVINMVASTNTTSLDENTGDTHTMSAGDAVKDVDRSEAFIYSLFATNR